MNPNQIAPIVQQTAPVVSEQTQPRVPRNLPSFGLQSKAPALAPKRKMIAKTSFGVETLVGDSNTGEIDTAENQVEAAFAAARDYSKKNKVKVTLRGTIYWEIPE